MAKRAPLLHGFEKSDLAKVKALRPIGLVVCEVLEEERSDTRAHYRAFYVFAFRLNGLYRVYKGVHMLAEVQVGEGCYGACVSSAAREVRRTKMQKTLNPFSSSVICW